jgi:membrane dipeptidase
MRKAGFDETNLRKFALDNWLRVFDLTWRRADPEIKTR